MNFMSLLKIIKRNFTMHIQFKLFIVSSFVTMVPIILFGFISYNLSAQKVKDDFITSNLNTNTVIAQNIDGNMFKLQQQIFSLFTLYNELDYLLNKDTELYSDDYFDSINRLDKYYSFHLPTNNIFGISLINMEGDVKYTINLDGKNTNLLSVKNEEWFKDTIALNGKTLFREPHINEFLFYNTGDKPTTIVSISQMVYNFNYGEPLGVILINQEMESFFGYTTNSYLSKNHILTVFSNDGKLVYSNKSLSDEMFNAYHSIYSNDTETIRSLTISGKDILFISNPVSKFGFRIISSVPISELRNESKFLKENTFLTLGILIVVVLILTTIISKLLTKRINKINQIFSEIRQGNFDVQIPVTGEDEISQITDSFNKTVHSIRLLIKEKYKANILRQRAELDSLHAQINPHFLYNTLSSVQVVIESGDNATASSMIHNLSDLLRYTLSKGKYLVSLKEEISHVKNYMAIQMERFKGQYKIMYEIDDQSLHFQIPWMTLQPIVENCIKHGLKNMKINAEIRITAKISSENLIIYVHDNGSGIESKKLNLINKSLSEKADTSTDNSKSIGIYNVNKRIKMHFGDIYGMTITSSPNSYTIVKITLPLQKGDCDNENTDSGR